MIRIVILFFILYHHADGQIVPTVPQNVFRLTYGNHGGEDSWDLGQQPFNLTDIGRMYFDHQTISDSGRFSSRSDLYHMGDIAIDSIRTVESWLSWFNEYKGTNLPIFEAGYVDTTQTVVTGGQFTDSRKRSINGRKLKIEYGMSDRITLSVAIPVMDTYEITQSVTAQGNAIYGIDELVNFHRNAKSGLESFIASDTYFFMRSGLRDTVQMIYNLYYTENGDYSVLWALTSSNDPFNSGFTDARFFSDDISKDTVDLADLTNYYYPSRKKGSGVDDVTLGVTMLLLGSPSWAGSERSGALYGQFKIQSPYGYTIRSYLSDGAKQFSQTDVGSGVTRWSIGFFGEYGFKGKMKPRFYGNISYVASTPEFLNTPVSLFTAKHSHPDSIINRIGEKYKYSEGNWARHTLGFDFEPKPDRIRVRMGTNYASKGQDKFYSNDKEWDNWMRSHQGYDSSLRTRHIMLEGWLINSISQNRIGPFSFDLYAGYQRTISSENTYEGWKIYWGSTFYIQGW